MEDNTPPDPPLSSPTEPYPRLRPHATLFRLGLQPLIVHFKSLGNGYMDPTTLESFDTKILRRILSDTAKNETVREQLGHDRAVWLDLRDLFYASVHCLLGQCCQRTYPDPAVSGSNGEDLEADDTMEDVASSVLIVKNFATLVKDVARLVSLVAIARNILTVGAAVQDLAAETKVEEGVFAVLGLCVRVTGRGFDSGGTKDDEKRWQTVVNDFKRLLGTCLQFLNNLVAQNERRKLLLWVQLFDSPPESDGSGAAIDRRLIESLREDPIVNGSAARGTGNESLGLGKDGVPHVIRRFKDGLLAHMNRLEDRRQALGRPVSASPPVLDKEHLSSSPFLLYIGKVGMDIKKELSDSGKPAGATEIATECKRRWQAMSKDEQKSWHDYYSQLLTNYKEEMESGGAGDETDPDGSRQQLRKTVVTLAQTVEQIQADLRNLQIESYGQEEYDKMMGSKFEVARGVKIGDGPLYSMNSSSDNAPLTDEDFRITYSSRYGAAILRQGKEDLLRRLEPDHSRASRSRRARTRSPPPPPPVDVPPRSESQPVPDPPDAPLTLASEDEREMLSEDEDSEYDDPVSGDDGRGLLTDVPLILGPTEIEVLPMIIQSGIVPPKDGQPGYGQTKEENAGLKTLHTLRCHLLLAQDNGRNLIRELLIFVAAWDLREEELYFQLMTQIIEAVLTNGLLPFAYHAFRESKDIISPAQAVIMKLLTHIFRRRQADTARRGLAIFPRVQKEGATPPPKIEGYPQRVDVHMVSFLLTEFRRQIIPQTCALVFLQGQIRNGMVSPEDFPLNLWDMERMYEGIYQYLEFFAILTEHERWKQMMADWEITYELITLLEELDAAIPRATARNARGGADWGKRAASRALAPGVEPGQTPSPLATDSQESLAQSLPPQPVAVERPYDPHASVTPEIPAPLPPAPPPLEDEPSDFEWRNLKKLAVLVLSSLLWKGEKVREQLGNPGKHDNIPGRGIRALLNCCKVDDYNPYIREHAIMALRFALEGNPRNQEIVHNLQKMGQEEPAPFADTAAGAARPQDPYPGFENTGGTVSLHEDGLNRARNGEATFSGRTPSGNHVEVPREVLDLHGYETFVDARGQVQLKKRDGRGKAAAAYANALDDFGDDDFM